MVLSSAMGYCVFHIQVILLVLISKYTAQSILTHVIYPEGKCLTNNSCLTLLDVVRNSSEYFASNSQLVFHPGDHTLWNEKLRVFNVSNLTLRSIIASKSNDTSGYPATRIVCTNSSLAFSGVSGLSVIAIDFTYCSTELILTDSIFQDISFGNGTADLGGALAIRNSYVDFVGFTAFIGNSAIEAGGAIYVNDSNLSFSGETTYTDNYSPLGGALLVLEHTSLSFCGNTIFERNTAMYAGGALCAFKSNSIVLRNSSFFQNNVTNHSGGAVYLHERNFLAFIDNGIFKGNSAIHGGVLYAHLGNSLAFHGTMVFSNNVARFGGAVRVYWNNTMICSGNQVYFNNTAEVSGGALYAQQSNTLFFHDRNRFENNSAVYGGAVYFYEGNFLAFNDNGRFQGNSATDGGVMYAGLSNSLAFHGTMVFSKNVARFGGALRVYWNNTVICSGNQVYFNNTAEVSGGALYAQRSNTLFFQDRNRFENNLAVYGGAVYGSQSNSWMFTGNSSFEGHRGHLGGVMCVVFFETVLFKGNSSFRGNIASYGGAIYAEQSKTCIFTGSSIFEGNEADLGGALFSWEVGDLKFSGNALFENNMANHGGGLYVQDGHVTFEGQGRFRENNVSGDGYGGAILTASCTLIIGGNYEVGDNTAGYGGGIALIGFNNNNLLLSPQSNWTLSGNAASRRGGAVYVEDNPFTYCTDPFLFRCFFQLSQLRQCGNNNSSKQELLVNLTKSISLTFYGNTAVESGDTIYGGLLETCVVRIQTQHLEFCFDEWGLHIIEEVTNFNISNVTVSSDPKRVCVCKNNKENCMQRTVTYPNAYPGEIYVVSLVAVGQMNGTVPSVIRAVPENLIITSDFQETQPAEINKGCSRVQYPLRSQFPNGTLKLYSDEPCSTLGDPLTIQITFLPCPVGFTLSNQGECTCDDRLQQYTQECVIQNRTITREHGDSYWVGVKTDSGSEGLILHPHCPFDYCTRSSVTFQLTDSGIDLQCTDQRSGVLCGACQSGHSLALGSSQCLSHCSNRYLALLLVFALAGLVLVAFLFLCRLTVAEGTLSGLIFYANILAINRSIFFPSGSTNPLTVFIAWLNLDLGIETCFIVSLDTYAQTWLQFAFPIYIWVIVALIIYFASISTVVARIIGRTNPVAVLATLFLLSYTKLLRAVMVAFSFTTLSYPNEDYKVVWLYDGNIGYLDKRDGRHIALFLFSLLVFLFIFLPYTLLLLCGQWIMKKTELRWLSPAKQLYLKAFLDAYYAPFTDSNRYWTGLLLLIRFFVLLLSTIINIRSPQNPFVHLVVLLCTMSGLQMWLFLIVHRLYKKWYLDVLEASFTFNLIILVGGTYQIRLSGGNQLDLVYTSASVAFTTFAGITLASIVRQVIKEIRQVIDAYQERRRNAPDLNGPDNHNIEESLLSPTDARRHNATHSSVEIAHASLRYYSQ